MLQQSCVLLQGYCSTDEDISLQGYVSCRKINAAIKYKKNIYFIAHETVDLQIPY